ncbi:thiol:disulfide interchange protein DsbA/DsbL [Pasteurellaceae bacterium LIM206]|nr:thiol:disulfide interchange protein DsbA/DsbL [Pasteurellaceae bacterium LIM206]
MAIEPVWAESAVSNSRVFADGRDYFSYRTPIAEDSGKDKRVQIQSFFLYDCRTCVNTQDILALYSQLNADKVVLKEYPIATEEADFTARVYYSLMAMDLEEVSDALLFESSDADQYASLSQMEKLLAWLRQQRVDTVKFRQLYQSEEVSRQVSAAIVRTEKYGVFTYPFVVIQGKYVLTDSTLYNDDYTFAVLDFLVNKLLIKE